MKSWLWSSKLNEHRAKHVLDDHNEAQICMMHTHKATENKDYKKTNLDETAYNAPHLIMFCTLFLNITETLTLQFMYLRWESNRCLIFFYNVGVAWNLSFIVKCVDNSKTDHEVSWKTVERYRCRTQHISVLYVQGWQQDFLSQYIDGSIFSIQ